MPQITDAEIIKSRTDGADCCPLFEAIIAQRYIAGIWAYSDANCTVFEAAVDKQFIGVMHAGTTNESHWENDDCGWIEDGVARKGEQVSAAVFTEYTEALDHLIAETKRLTIEIFGGLEAEMLAV